HYRMMSDAFPTERSDVLGGRRRAQTDEAQIDFPRFEGGKLLCRGHVEQVHRDFRTSLVERCQGRGEEIEVEIEQIAEIELARFAPAEALNGRDAFQTQGHKPAGID